MIISILSLFPLHISLNSFSGDNFKNLNDSLLAIKTDGFDNAAGFGFFAYIDLPKIPTIGKTALQFDYEVVGNTYDYTTTTSFGQSFESSFIWYRGSTYFTLRKTAMAVKIPFLAKAQIYYGAGLNSHSYLPTFSLDTFEDAFSADLDESLANPDTDELIAFLEEIAEPASGFHLLGGAQVKVLFANVFLNARYTMATDVYLEKGGFLSIWTGVAFGF